MPRQHREIPVQRVPSKRRWPALTATIALVALFAVAALAAWYFEGRYTVTPAEQAKLVVPFPPNDIRTVEITTPDGVVAMARNENGKLALTNPAPTPIPSLPTPPPGATPVVPEVTVSPETRVQSALTDLNQAQYDRVVVAQPSAAPEYGLDKPQAVLDLETTRGQVENLAIGGLNPDQTAYYVRRQQQGDTVLVSRYTLDDLIKTAQAVLKGSS